MLKYSSFLLIASMWFSTVLCVTEQSTPQLKSANEASKDDVNDYFKKFFEDVKDISTSSHAFAKFIRDGVEKCVEHLEEGKKEIKHLEDEATEMKKKIQKIVKTFQESTIPIKKELQSELEYLGNNASTELKRMIALDIYNNFEGVKTKFTTSYNDFKSKLGAIFKMVLEEIQNTAKSKQKDTSGLSTMRDMVSDLIKNAIQIVVTKKNDDNGLHDKFYKARVAHSTIRNGLIRAEQIEFYVLQSHTGPADPKAEPKNDPQNDRKKEPNKDRKRGTKAEPTKEPKEKTDSSIRTSLTKCVLAIMLGMLF